WSLRAQALPHRGICIWRTSKQAPGCRDIKSYRSNGKPASGVGQEETINRLSSVAGAMAIFQHLPPHSEFFSGGLLGDMYKMAPTPGTEFASAKKTLRHIRRYHKLRLATIRTDVDFHPINSLT